MTFLPTTSFLHEFLFCFLLQFGMLDLICEVLDLFCEVLDLICEVLGLFCEILASFCEILAFNLRSAGCIL